MWGAEGAPHRAGKAPAEHEQAGTRMSPARLRQIRVDGKNPQGKGISI